MSYSRWGQSVWYTYYGASDGKFHIMSDHGHHVAVTATEIRADWDRIITSLQIPAHGIYRPEQIKELEEYRDAYLKDWDEKTYRLETHSFD
jgi:hypothetical protein